MRNFKILIACAMAAAITPWATGQALPKGTLATTVQASQAADLDIVSGPTVEKVNATSAIITWKTSAQASSTIKYGTDKNNLTQTAHGGWGGPEHTVTVTNLKPNTTYYFQVESLDAKGSGTGSIAKTGSFHTVAEGAGGSTQASGDRDRDLDITKAPVVEQVSNNSVTIAWTTDAKASSTIAYGTDKNNLNETKHGGWGGPEHRVTITNLKPNTTYYYQVKSTQGQGTGTGDVGSIQSFQTKPEAQAKKK